MSDLHRSNRVHCVGLSSEQQRQLCAEMCAGHEPFDLECDDLTFRSDDDQAGCIETCEESLASFNDCYKTVADYREITVTGDSTCEETGDAFAASLAIQLACSPFHAAVIPAVLKHGKRPVVFS